MKRFFNIFVDTLIVLSLILFVFISCRKTVGVDPVVAAGIDLGKTSTSTSIKTFSQTGSTVTMEFATTPGAKYSVQFTPFALDNTVKTDKFTATDTVTKKIYDLSDLPKKDYDVHFIDIQGKEDKHPVIIK